MTEELNLLREALRRVKHEAASLADAQVIALEALTQRPAAQAGEREVFEAWADANVQSDYSKSDRHFMWWGWQARASLPTQPAAQEMPDAVEHYGTVDDLPAAQATPDHAAEIARLKAVIDQLERREILAVAQQATPEPAGEALQFHPMPEGWPARFRCDSCDGNGELGELVSMGDFQPPERQTCPDCGGRGWTSEEHAFNADHMREFAEAHALLTRPAPGVPEGLQWFTVAERGMPDFDEEVIAGLWYTDPCLKPEFATRFMWGLCRVFKDDYRDFKDGKRWHTFGPSHNQITHWARFNWPALAAQAKGGQ